MVKERKPQTPKGDNGMVKERKPQTPGDDESSGSDPDAAIAAGQAGQARRIPKPRVPVAPAELEVADETRPDGANINSSRQMAESRARDLDRKGELQRPMLTESGWYVPRNSRLERAARKKNGEPELVEIE